MRTAQDIVRGEVHYCVSTLVSLVAEGTNFVLLRRDQPFTELCYQAQELAAPIDDWIEAAIEHGMRLTRDNTAEGKYAVNDPPPDSDMSTTLYETGRHAAIAYCDFHGLDPCDREVYEHWIISDWLADQLEARGEKIDHDFAGLTVWARTTTGQAIYADPVFETIAADLTR